MFEENKKIENKNEVVQGDFEKKLQKQIQDGLIDSKEIFDLEEKKLEDLEKTELLDKILEKEEEIKDLIEKNKELFWENKRLKKVLNNLEGEITHVFKEIQEKEEWKKKAKEIEEAWGKVEISENTENNIQENNDNIVNMETEVGEFEKEEKIVEGLVEKLKEDEEEYGDKEEKKKQVKKDIDIVEDTEEILADDIELIKQDEEKDSEVDFSALEQEFQEAVKQMELEEKIDSKEKKKEDSENEKKDNGIEDIKDEKSFENIEKQKEKFQENLKIDLKHYDLKNILNEIDYIQFTEVWDNDEYKEIVQEAFNTVAIDLMKNEGVDLIKILNEKIGDLSEEEKKKISPFLEAVKGNFEFQEVLKNKIIEFFDYVDGLDDDKIDLVTFNRIDELLEDFDDKQKKELFDDFNIKEKIKRIVKKFNSLKKNKLVEKFSQFLPDEEVVEINSVFEKEVDKEQIFKDFLKLVEEGKFDKTELKRELKKMVKNDNIIVTDDKKKAIKEAWLNRKKV